MSITHRLLSLMNSELMVKSAYGEALRRILAELAH